MKEGINTKQPSRGVLMISHATNNRRALCNKPSSSMLQSIAQSVSMFGGEESRALLEQIYAKEIAVDYTSQLEGDQNDRTLMAQWAAALPGFDHTRYTLSDVSLHLQFQGNQLEAEVRVGADRWVDDLFLEIEKTYVHHVKDDLRPSQVLSRTLQTLTDSGRWQEGEAVQLPSCKEAVHNFFTGLCFGEVETLSQRIAESAQFSLQTERLGVAELKGRKEILPFLMKMKEQQEPFCVVEQKKVYSLDGDSGHFVKWPGGAGYFVVQGQLITKVQTYLS